MTARILVLVLWMVAAQFGYVWLWGDVIASDFRIITIVIASVSPLLVSMSLRLWRPQLPFFVFLIAAAPLSFFFVAWFWLATVGAFS